MKEIPTGTDPQETSTTARPKIRLLNVSHTKEFILHLSKEMGRPFTRVSLDHLFRLEARLKSIIRDEVHRHPSKGVTLK